MLAQITRELVVARDHVELGAPRDLKAGAFGVVAVVSLAVELGAFAAEHVEAACALDGAALVADDEAAIHRLAVLRTDTALQRRDEEHRADLVVTEVRRDRAAGEQRIGGVVLVLSGAHSELELHRGTVEAFSGRAAGIVEIVADHAGALDLQALAAVARAQLAILVRLEQRREIPRRPRDVFCFEVIEVGLDLLASARIERRKRTLADKVFGQHPAGRRVKGRRGQYGRGQSELHHHHPVSDRSPESPRVAHCCGQSLRFRLREGREDKGAHICPQSGRSSNHRCCQSGSCLALALGLAISRITAGTRGEIGRWRGGRHPFRRVTIWVRRSASRSRP